MGLNESRDQCRCVFQIDVADIKQLEKVVYDS